jgi:predicted DNA-binding transcriptional regulator AlpA
VLADLGLIPEPTAAAMLGIGYTTLRRMRMRGDGPPFVVLGSRLVRYRASDLEGWLTKRAAVAS